MYSQRQLDWMAGQTPLPLARQPSIELDTDQGW